MMKAVSRNPLRHIMQAFPGIHDRRIVHTGGPGRVWRLSGALLVIVIASFGAAPAQTTDSLVDEKAPIIQSLDSLTRLLFSSDIFGGPLAEDDSLNRHEHVPVFDDHVYEQRLGMIPSLVPLPFNRYVKNYIHVYAIQRREQVNQMLGLSQMYFPIFEEVLDRYNMPMILKYLPVIESALNPHAVSRAGATGLWQFMYFTAKSYGLSVNSYVDERRDPWLSTEAAVRFLKDLYGLYGDWGLAIAAYNCGPGNVNKAIRRAGGQTDYWSLRPYLPRETRGYYPAFIAATYIMSYFADHNLRPVLNPALMVHLDTVLVNGELDLQVLAESIDVPLELILFHNPALKRSHIPRGKTAYALRIPIDKLMAFESVRESLYERSAETRISSQQEPATADIRVASTAPKPVREDFSGKTCLKYAVKTDDNLGYIAEWYECSMSDLRRWNNVWGSRITVGQVLNVYVASEKAERYARINEMSFDQKQKLTRGPIPMTGMEMVHSIQPQVEYLNYEIKSGDTLWDLSRKYPKNSVEELKMINNLEGLRDLKPGMVIKLVM